MLRFNFVVLVGLLLCLGVAQASDKRTFLAFVRGDVRLNGVAVEQSVPVAAGDVVETGEGKCALVIGDMTVVHLGSESKMEVTQAILDSAGPKIELKMPYGKIRAMVKNVKKNVASRPRFVVRTRAAVMGVRGTHIFVDSPVDLAKPQQFVTFEGSAQLELPGLSGVQAQVLALNASQSVMVGDSGVAKTETLSEEQMQDLANEVAPAPKLNGEGDVSKRSMDLSSAMPSTQRAIGPVASEASKVKVHVTLNPEPMSGPWR